MAAEKDLETILSLLAMVPDPAKGAALNLMLGTLMAIRDKDGGTIMEKTLAVTTGCAFAFVFSHMALSFGMSPGWVYAINGGVAVYGVDQSKQFLTKIRDSFFKRFDNGSDTQ